MLLHSCITVHSMESAINVFESVLKLKHAYSFDVEPKTMRQLFHQDYPVHVRVYDAGNSLIEVFISPNLPKPGLVQHLCFDCDDRTAVVERAEAHGMTVRRFARKSGDVIFIQDTDGNLIELKEVSNRNQ